MIKPVFKSIHPECILSFGPEFNPLDLRMLNVLIGPNGSGKSNLIELFELIRATPTDLPGFLRPGGGAAGWVWKGERNRSASASVSAVIEGTGLFPDLRYRIEFTETTQRLEIVDEVVEETTPRSPDHSDVYFYYRFQQGHPAINTQKFDESGSFQRQLRREDLNPQQSVLSQRKDPDFYPEITELSGFFSGITTFREWTFGRQVALRQPQPTDLPSDVLLPDLRNLGLILNGLEHSDKWPELNSYLTRFLPRFRYVSTKLEAGHVQIYLHEDGLRSPIPATRLSDGTIRFLALLAILMRPEVSSLICIDEPELGLHPDAVSLVATLLVEASKTTQLIVATHSESMVSALTDHTESVLVSGNDSSGTMLTRLESKKLEFWLGKYRLGEIWRMGELGGNP